MRYVLGVDGGQTSTTAVLADEQGCLLGVGHGGPANHIYEPGGPERVRRSVSDAIRNAIKMADLENARIACACLGMTRASQEMKDLCAPVVPADTLLFGQDTRIALYSVTFGRPGVAIIGGTGSAAFGKNALDQEASAGGWGYLLGDEGSGYWIALRALNACCRSVDGMQPTTQLVDLLLVHLQCQDIYDVHSMVYAGGLPRPDIAALAEVVSRAAALGDPIARRILREAGRELALTVNAVLKRLGLQSEAVTVGTVGGVFRAGRLVLRTFREVIHSAAPEAVIIPSRVPAAVGAALMALESLDVTIHDALLSRIETTLPRLGAVKC